VKPSLKCDSKAFPPPFLFALPECGNRGRLRNVVLFVIFQFYIYADVFKENFVTVMQSASTVNLSVTLDANRLRVKYSRHYIQHLVGPLQDNLE
jgi:hypothetical protein